MDYKNSVKRVFTRDAKMECIIGNDSTIIKLGQSFDITSVNENFSILKDLLTTNHAIQIIADEVTRIDMAGLQLLLSFYLACQQNKVSLHCQKFSSALQTAIELAGMHPLLALTSDVKGGSHAN